jgi:hypothetical protein
MGSHRDRRRFRLSLFRFSFSFLFALTVFPSRPKSSVWSHTCTSNTIAALSLKPSRIEYLKLEYKYISALLSNPYTPIPVPQCLDCQTCHQRPRLSLSSVCPTFRDTWCFGVSSARPSTALCITLCNNYIDADHSWCAPRANSWCAPLLLLLASAMAGCLSIVVSGLGR